jgi:hypothetical protein
MQSTSNNRKDTSSRMLDQLRGDFVEELSRLFARIERGRGPRDLEEVTITLSKAGRYKGVQSGWKLSEEVFILKKTICVKDIISLKDIVILDGFLGVWNEKTLQYDGLDFLKHVMNMTSGTQGSNEKADSMSQAISYLRNL